MGKKYLETKKGTLESSILGVWQNAIEEGDAREAAARMDGRTKGYKSHRAKLEAARTRREEKKKLNREAVTCDCCGHVDLDEAKGYLELEFKDSRAAENAYSQINNKILPGGNPPYEDFNQEGNTLQFDTRDKNQTRDLMKELQSGGLKGFKVAVQEEIEFDVEVEQLAEASGDKEAYKKFFDAALKKFKVSSPAEFKSDEEKKKFFDYIDKNWTGDHEESINHVKEFKIQSMKDALAKVWDVGEGHNPFKKEDDEKKVKKNKTETGKEPATVDLKPKIDD